MAQAPAWAVAFGVNVTGCTLASATFDGLAPAAGAAIEVGIGQIGHGANVFVATARQVDQNGLVRAHGFGQLHGVGHGVAGLQRGNDAFGAAQVVEGVQRLFVGDAHIFGAANVLQPCVLGAHAGVVQAGADAVRFGDLAVVVLQDVGAVAMQHARAAFLQ
jgi:hypothetical protein